MNYVSITVPLLFDIFSFCRAFFSWPKVPGIFCQNVENDFVNLFRNTYNDGEFW